MINRINRFYNDKKEEYYYSMKDKIFTKGDIIEMYDLLFPDYIHKDYILKVEEIISIINEGVMPCCKYSNWYNFIMFIENFQKFEVNQKVKLPFGELGKIVKYNDKLWGSTYTVKITKGTVNTKNDLIEYKRVLISKI